jgi:subtilisin-like proprotein convertase family protein
MKGIDIRLFCIWILLALPIFSSAQSYFQFTSKEGSAFIDDTKVFIKPEKQQFVNYNIDALRNLLRGAPQESRYNDGMPGAKLNLPSPDGRMIEFDIYESKIMDEPDYSSFPNIRTYIAVNSKNKVEHGRIDVTEQGFHAMIFTDGDTYFIEPASLNNQKTLISYYKRDNKEKGDFSCGTQSLGINEEVLEERTPLSCNSSMNLVSYRTAVACTFEYGAFHGGTVALALSAIVTTVNRVSGVYEKDLGVRLILIGNNSLILYTAGNGYTSSNDPYTNGNGSAMLSQNKTNLNAVILTANYDIGHVVSTGGGGVASLSCVCTTNKAQGVTGSGTPIGDVFDIDYVAHEMGHQFGGNHTFNGSTGSCSGGNRNGSTAYEPGSGSTIQAYAGICSPQDIQPHSDAYFTNISLLEMLTHVNTTTSCRTNVSGTNNTTPQITSYTSGKSIPANTPFFMDATATDPNGDVITYCWEENDLGSAGDIDAASTTKPIFRTFNPTTSGRRYFPRTQDVLNNLVTYGEVLPSVARTLSFIVTARDNHATGGGICRQTTSITVVANTGFAVTAPNTAVTWASPSMHDITWNVNGTTSAPISCPNVDIQVSFDNGLSFFTIANNTPNDGTFSWNIPSGINSNQVRIRIVCSNNVFYDVNNVPFTIGNPDQKCFTYTNNSPVSIPANLPGIYSSSIFTSGFGPNEIVTDVNITNINATHTAIGDLQINLTSALGASNILVYDKCSSSDDMNIGFDDEASSSTVPCPPTGGGSIKPQEFLNIHKGLPANGQWTLSLNDWYSGNGGTLNSWSLEICVSQKTVLPLTLLSFTAEKSGENSLLKWTTTNEDEVRMFQIEKLENGSYRPIGNVNTANNSSKQSYSYIDKSPYTGINYYRIKTIDLNGSFVYSEIATLNFSNRIDASVYPNPASTELHVKTNSEKAVIKNIQIFDLTGKEYFIKANKGNGTEVSLDISSLKNGVYVLQLNTGEDNQLYKFIKI